MIKWIIGIGVGMLFLGCSSQKLAVLPNGKSYYVDTSKCNTSSLNKYTDIVTCKDKNGNITKYYPLHPNQVAHIKQEQAYKRQSMGELNRAMIQTGQQMQQTYAPKNYNVNVNGY